MLCLVKEFNGKEIFDKFGWVAFYSSINCCNYPFGNYKKYAFAYSLKNRFILHAPQIAVTFFFVLSGFLIMWWFLEETDGDLKKINIRKFYINRIARTWPLYFMVVAISIVISFINGSIFSDSHSVKRFFLYMIFMN